MVNDLELKAVVWHMGYNYYIPEVLSLPAVLALFVILFRELSERRSLISKLSCK